MKFRNIISVGLLAVYTIVVAHNFIPHHHHSEITETTHICHHEDHQHFESVNAVVDHSHDANEHIHCSFNEKIILTKGLTLSAVHLPANPFVFYQYEENKQLLSDLYHLVVPQEPQCRDVQLRGPPFFS
jgi:hypothetical protein